MHDDRVRAEVLYLRQAAALVEHIGRQLFHNHVVVEEGVDQVVLLLESHF